MTTIGFVRHGITSWNLEGRNQGNTDIPLHDLGIEGARKMANRLAKEDWNVIYSSPLLRARQTAEIIHEQLPKTKLKFDDRLREVAYGQIEGTTRQEALDKWGEGYQELDLGVEPASNVIDRGLAVIEEIKCSYPNEKVLIVSHGAFIRTMIQALTPDFVMEERLENTSLTIIELNEDQNSCVLYNCTKHLSY